MNRRSPVGLIAAIALMIGLSACAAPAPNASPSATATATASATPAPAESPSPAADALLISAEGIGPYQLGGSFAEARAVLGVPAPEEGEDRCPWFAAVGDPDSLMTYVIADTPDGVTTTDVIISVAVQGDGAAEGSPQTVSGVGLGSSEGEVLAAYPDAAPEDVLYADSALRVTDVDNSIVFQFRADSAYMITVLPATESVPAEYCG